MPRNDNVTMEDVRIVFRNFAGQEGQFNREGDRNFHVVLPEDVARAMEADGWNIKWPKPKPDLDPAEDARLPTLPVKVKFNDRGPRVLMIGDTSKKRTTLDEESISVLDWVDVKTVDLTVRPYAWTMFEGTPQENTGITAYLQQIFITIHEDALELKYAEDEQEPVRHGGHDDAPWEE